jgi:hypothetical protein
MSEDDQAFAHVIEPAASGRSICRGCARPIGKGTWRFGERLPNPYGEGAMTLWLHVPCAAYRRPESFLPTLREASVAIDDAPWLAEVAQFSLDHHRMTRIAGLERAPSGRARCRACRQPIDKGTLRIPLVFYQEGTFERSGFIHIGCAIDYCGTHRLLACVRHFAGELSDADLSDAAKVLG